MAAQKVYSITINGLQESIKAVDALNESLEGLEKRIKALESKSINVGAKTSSTSSSSGSKTSTSSLSEEAKLEKQIAQLEEKRVAHSKQIYQNYLAAKDVLAETDKDQKQLAASERLAANTYTNTISGMKQELADIKSVMQTIDLGDTKQLDQMVKRADELNSKLKKIEESYGQFGRNVGNYSSAFDGMQKLSISIGGVTREFDTAKQAAKTLKNELIGLEAAGSGNTEVAKELRSEYYKLQSAMDDATKSSKAMDTAMDTMQSFTAMASIGNGIKAFFGFDDNEIQKSIQRLVALQGVLNGIETIRKQMETGEGFGGYFKKSFEAVDAANFKLKRLTVSLLGTGTAAKTAAIGVNALATAAKALSAIGIVALISAATWAIQKAVEAVSDWARGNANLVTSEQRLKIALDATNDSLERNLKLNQAKYDASKLNDAQLQVENEKAYAAAIQATNKQIEERLKLNSNNSTFAKAVQNAGKQSGINDFLQNDKGVTTFGGFTTAAKDIDELIRRYNALNEAVKKNEGLIYKDAEGFERAHLSASDVRDELNHLEQFLAGNMVGAMKAFDLSTEEGRKGLQNFVNQIMQSDNELYKSLLLRLPEVIDNEKGALGDALNQWLSLIRQFVANADSEMRALNFEKFAQGIVDSADKTGKRIYQRQRENLKAQYGALTKEQQQQQKKLYDNALAAIDKNEAEATRKVTTALNTRYKKEAAEIEAGERYKNELTIKLMKDGLAKVLKQIDEEERQELVKAKKYGADLNKVHEYYDRKRLEEKRKWAEEVRNVYLKLYNDLRNLINENENIVFENEKKKIENHTQLMMSAYQRQLAMYGASRDLTNYGSVKDITKRQPSTYDYSQFSKEDITKAKEYVDVIQKLSQAENGLQILLRSLPEDEKKWTNEQKDTVSQAKEVISYFEKEKELLAEQTDLQLAQAIAEDSYSKDLTEAFQTRLRERENYYQKVNDLNNRAYKKELEAQKEHLEKLKQNEIEDAGQRYVSKNSQNVSDRVEQLGKWRSDNNLYDTESWKTAMENLYKDITEANGRYFGENGELVQALREGKLDIDEFFNLSLQEAQQYREKLKNINEKYDEEEKALQNQTNQELRTSNAEYYNQMISEFSDFSQELNNRYGRQPVINNFRIVDIAKTKKNLQEVKNGFINLMNEILRQKIKLQNALDNNEISFDDFKLAQSQLNDLENKVRTSIQGVEAQIKDLPGEFIASVNQYIQAGLQAVQTVMQAIADYQDYEFDKQQEQLEKEAEMLDEQLDKQQQIVQEHKDNINSIEDELATSRGDRRQHLIDQLNAEIAAQRAAQAEEKRIQKQKEANERKQEQLEKKRREAEYKRNLVSIIISTAMATANGLATQPFWPVGVAMGALATALGMAQYALAAAQKPYAKGGQLDGGVAVGNRHRDGGIKVLGGRAEIEGGEFITNRISTQMNAPLLEFINSKKKRIDVADLMEFYSSGSVKKNIAKVRTKFEDGGYVPTLPNSIDVRDQLQNIIINQDNRPIYVSVVDINNKQEQVRQVQTLAGLSND